MAGNVIEEFLIELGFVDKGVSKGIVETEEGLEKTRKSSKRTADDLEKNGAQGALFFKQIRNEALLLLSLFAGSAGIERIVKNTVNSMANLGFTAANMEMAPERLQAWGMAAEKAGGSAESMTRALAQANKDAVSFAHEGGRAVSERLASAHIGDLSFFSLGGKFDPKKYANNPEEWLKEQSRVLKEAVNKYGKADALALAQMWGLDEGAFNLLVQGPDVVKKLVDAQKELANKNKDATEKAQGLRVVLSGLQDRFNAVAVDITLALLPAIKWAIFQFERFGEWILAHKDEFVVMVKDWYKSAQPFLNQIDELVQKMGGWENILIGLAAIRLLPLINSLGLLALSLGKVSMALGVMWAGMAEGEAIHKKFGEILDPLIEKGLNAGEKIIEYVTGEGKEGAAQENLKAMRKASKQYGFDYDVVLDKYAEVGKKYGIDPNLLIAQTKQESGFNPKAVSPAGAKGFSQFMPDTAKDIGLANPFDPLASIEAQAKLMRINLDKFGRTDLALGAYNAGAGNIKNNQLPNFPETQNYVKKILGNYEPINIVKKETHPIEPIVKKEPPPSTIIDSLNNLLGHKPESYQDWATRMHKPIAIANGATAKPMANTTTNNAQTDVKINAINITTQATDAKGIAQSIRPAMMSTLFNNFNTGQTA